MAYYHGGQYNPRGGIGGGQQQQNGEYFSTTYMWHQRDRLGQGATGQVFVGYNKKTGDKVAVKMFTRMSEYRAMHNEMQTIKHLKAHKNIVQFLEIDEVEKYTNAHIIVMEICNGGSLYEVIDSPQNAFGLDEYQFKSVIFDVANGLRHLRTHGFVHRDIKPGNIMRCLNPDGSYVFKLADFGTARQLQPDEHFTSLHGTEEYLYPAMYERALINVRSQEEFVDKVDLWSVGATFFHLATGRLPFRPYKKREDKGTMYKIIKEKKSGAILGWQQAANGPIYYSKELPPDSVISEGLQILLTPILAGLLDHFENMYGFDRFFQEIEEISKKKVVHVFCVSQCTYKSIYIDPQIPDSIPVLKELIAKQTRLNSQHMELFFENILQPSTDPVHASDLPNTTADSPLTVFGGPPQKPDSLSRPEPVQCPHMPPDVAIVDDLRYAKEATKAIWQIFRSAERIHRCYSMMNQAALCLRESLEKDYKSWCKKFDEVKLLYRLIISVSTAHIQSLQCDISFLQALNPLCNNVYDSDISDLRSQLTEKKRQKTEVEDDLCALEAQTQGFQHTIVEICRPTSWDVNYCSEIFNGSMKTMDTYVNKIQNLFQDFQEQKKSRGSPQANYERKAHEHKKRTIKNRLEEGEKKLNEMIIGRSHVYAKLYTFLERCTPVREDLKSYETSLDISSKRAKEISAQLHKWFPVHKDKMEQLQGKLSSIRGISPTPPSSFPSSPSSNDGISTQILELVSMLKMKQDSIKGIINEQTDTIKRYRRN